MPLSSRDPARRGDRMLSAGLALFAPPALPRATWGVQKATLSRRSLRAISENAAPTAVIAPVLREEGMLRRLGLVVQGLPVAGGSPRPAVSVPPT